MGILPCKGIIEKRRKGNETFFFSPPKRPPKVSGRKLYCSPCALTSPVPLLHAQASYIEAS